jgi:Mg-chelatase subunit ChlD
VIPVRVGREGDMPQLPRPSELPDDIRDLVHYQKHDVAYERFGRDTSELIAAIIAVRRAREPRKPMQLQIKWGWLGAMATSVLAIGWVSAHQMGVRVWWPFTGDAKLVVALSKEELAAASKKEALDKQVAAAEHRQHEDADRTAGASLIIVFDGSGTMWGNMEGAKKSKLIIAREAVLRGLAKISPQTRVGLAAFGHRRGDCGDVEVLRAPEPLDVPRISEPLEKLNPKGRGPLTLALREAAKAFPPNPGKKSLILIHDDADNCQQDVCAEAAELRDANITAHVVGLALKGEDAAKMACLPQITGGRFFPAPSANDVATAVEEALLSAARPPSAPLQSQRQ